MSTKKLLPAAAYIRVSTEDQTNGLSLPVQTKLCEKRAQEAGYAVIETLGDPGVSGKKIKRPGLERLRELITSQRISAVVALSSDRLFRNSLGHHELMNLIRKHDIKILYVNQASPDESAAAILSDAVIANINQFYSDQISEKVKGTLYAKVQVGHFPTVPPPGYLNADNPDPNADRLSRKIIVPDPVAAPLITELFQLYATGVYSVYDLTEMMNKRGLRSHKDYELSPSRVYDLLRNRMYLGEVRWGKAYNKNGKHKPLTDEPTFNQVQVVLDTNNHKACRRRKYQWLLSGFVYCANHQKRYVAEWH